MLKIGIIERCLTRITAKRSWEKTQPRLAPAPIIYWPLRWWIGIGFKLSTHTRITGFENIPKSGGYILACTHFSHVEPMCVSLLVPQRIHWMARTEFYRFKPFAWFLRLIDAFPVNRFGIPVKSIRTAVERAAGGRVVGIFPEGGVVMGPESVCLGGPIKRGVCMISSMSGTPIVPCVIVGTPRLNRFGAWVPGARTPIGVSFGKPIPPDSAPPGRAAARKRKTQRVQMADRLRTEFVCLYQHLRSLEPKTALQTTPK